MRKDRDTEACRRLVHALDMVVMPVCDKDCADGCFGDAGFGHPCAEHPEAYPAVDQHRISVGVDGDAVAVASTSKNRNPDSHLKFYILFFESELLLCHDAGDILRDRACRA